MRIEEFETIPCSQMCRWTPQGPRRPLTQQACQRSIPGIGISEINFLSHWKIKQFTFRMKESRIYLIVATQLVK